MARLSMVVLQSCLFPVLLATIHHRPAILIHQKLTGPRQEGLSGCQLQNDSRSGRPPNYSNKAGAANGRVWKGKRWNCIGWMHKRSCGSSVKWSSSMCCSRLLWEKVGFQMWYCGRADHACRKCKTGPHNYSNPCWERYGGSKGKLKNSSLGFAVITNLSIIK